MEPPLLRMKELKVYRDENNEWVVTSDKMPGFTAKGKTVNQAVEKMKKALNTYFPCGQCKESK